MPFVAALCYLSTVHDFLLVCGAMVGEFLIYLVTLTPVRS